MKKEELFQSWLISVNISGHLDDQAYSLKEKALFWDLKLEYLLSGSITPLSAYRTAAIVCFKQNLQGKSVESLRKCVIAFEHSTVNRKTPEWDAMIEIDELFATI